MLSKSHAVSNAASLCICHDPKIMTVRLQMKMAFYGSMSKIFTYLDGLCSLDRKQVKVVPVPP